MKNITVSLDDHLYRRSRIAAAEADTSVTALVREFLTEYTAGERTSESVHQASGPSQEVLRIVRKMRERHPEFDPEARLTREEIHAR
ncbi:MAG: hypothetical protein P1U81_11740 [Verrucomicrobiales bacterium]|jgi:plasmid stability protein|nr:hypothetical protein [Verrucomicrobiales bacterium]